MQGTVWPCLLTRSWTIPYFEGVHPDDHGRTEADVKANKQPDSGLKPDNYAMEFRTIGNDGVERWLLAKGHVFFDAEGGGPERRSASSSTSVTANAPKARERARLTKSSLIPAFGGGPRTPQRSPNGEPGLELVGHRDIC